MPVRVPFGAIEAFRVQGPGPVDMTTARAQTVTALYSGCKQMLAGYCRTADDDDVRE